MPSTNRFGMTHSNRFLRPAAAAALAVTMVGVPCGARAATAIGDYFTLSGFGTLGGVVTNSDAGQFGREMQSGGADKTPALDVDSNLGLQLDGKATSWLSGTLQTLTTKRVDLGITTRIAWAYLLVKPIDGLSLRAGHMATPSFLVSEAREIGYANNWVRPPNEVYGLATINSFDGYDATYRRSFGPVSVTVSGAFGKTNGRGHGLDATGDHLRAFNAQIETEWATLRAGRVKTRLSVPAIGDFGDDYSFTGYGLSIDRNDVVVQAEFVQRRTSKTSELINADAWYVTGGYRFGLLLPYAILSRTASKGTTLPVYFSGTQRTVALGLRWDAFKSADIKFQIDRIDTGGTNGISFTTPAIAPGVGLGIPVTGKVTAFSVALDFIF